MGRPTHDQLATLRQAGWIPREGNIKGGGKTWPASLFLLLPGNCLDANFSEGAAVRSILVFEVK